jgi:arginyl-tRNA synthetase
VVGESYYNEMLEGVVVDLAAAGLLVESEGALCVFPRDSRIVTVSRFRSSCKRATTVTVTRPRLGRGARSRGDVLKADELLYVVGCPQVQHLEMVFAVARLAGWLPDRVRCEQVIFGNVLGTDHKMFKSRAVKQSSSSGC